MACDILGTVALGNDAKSKLETLERLRNHIKELQMQCVLLENELVVQNRCVGSIRALPSEILSIIFGLYIQENPRLIRRLLLVCRQWHNVALHNPQLWTFIKIHASRYEGDYQWGAERLRPFIQACVQRSGAALLHIELDFQYVTPWGLYVEMEIISTLTNLFPNFPDSTYQWIVDEARSWSEDEDDDPPGHHSHIMELLHDLGPKSRWGSLELVNPYNADLADEIWNILAGGTPNLKSLSVYGYPDDNLGNLENPFSDLSSLKILKVSNIQTLQLVDPPSSLKHLEVGTFLDQIGVEELNRFTGLRTLKILSLYGDASSSDQPITLTLSMLRDLHFVNSKPSPAHIKYNLPALQDLFLTKQNEAFFEHPLDVQPVHVHWSLEWHSEGKVLSVAEKILTWFSRAKSMTTLIGAKAPVLEMAMRLKRDGKLSAELKTLVFQSSSGGVDEIIRVEDI